MHAPQYACQALYETSSRMRWCWLGAKRLHPDDENPGCFGLIRLYDESALHRPDIVPYDICARRGPLFSRKGVSFKRDWPDHLIPFLVLRLDGSRPAMGWGPEHVFSNGFAIHQKKTMCPQWVLDLNYHEFLVEKGRDVDTALTDGARQRASEFEHQNRFNPNYVLIDKEQIRKDVKAAGPEYDPRGPQFQNAFVEKFGSHLRITPT